MDIFRTVGGWTEEDFAVAALQPFPKTGFPEKTIKAITISFIFSSSVSEEEKKKIAEAITHYADSALRNGQEIEFINEAFLLKAYNLVVANETAWKTWRKENPEWRKRARELYIHEIESINDIFLEAIRAIREDPFMSYGELRERLLGQENGAKRFAALTPEQRARVEAMIVYFASRRTNAKNSFERARNKYPIDEFNAVTRRIVQLKKSGISDVPRWERLTALENQARSLQKQLIPYFEQELGISGEFVPEIAIIEIGPFGIEIETDAASIQMLLRAPHPIQENSDAASFLQEYTHTDSSAGNRCIDFDKLKAALRSLPSFLYGDFQNEMAAYMTDSELRFQSSERFLELYMIRYKARLAHQIEELLGDDLFNKNRERITSTLDSIWYGDEWLVVKARLQKAKELLDNLVDASATLNFARLKAENPAARAAELREEAYDEASLYVMGLFQLIPFNYISRLEVILKKMNKEIKRKGLIAMSSWEIAGVKTQKDMRKPNLRTPSLTLSLEDILSGRKSPVEDIKLYGFAQGNMIAVEFGDDNGIRNHERQHILYSLFTGFEARRYTKQISDFSIQASSNAAVEENGLGAPLIAQRASSSGVAGEMNKLVEAVDAKKVNVENLNKSVKATIEALSQGDSTQKARVVQDMMSELAKQKDSRARAVEVAVTGVMAEHAIAEIDPRHLNVVIQFTSDIGKSAAADVGGRAIRKLSEDYNGLSVKSIVDTKDQLDNMIARAKAAMDADKNPEEARTLFYLPQSMKGRYDYIIKSDARIRVQLIDDEGEYPDILPRLILGVGLLEFDRDRAKEPSQNLLNLIAAVTDGSQEPKDILKKLFENDLVLKIRKIDFKAIQEWKKAQDEVLRAL